jgi:UDP-2-acetamido-3-amino-2,3-dideoxy-glucuronate N-acetyltransferase
MDWRNARIGKGTKIWHPEMTNIYGDCVIGENCNIGAFVEIGPGVVIGNNVRVGAHCFIPSGVIIHDDCFIGPGCVFTNDRYPPGHKVNWESTVVLKGASIGAGCTILPGITIGTEASIGAGTVVTKDVPDGWRVIGNPMRRIGHENDDKGLKRSGFKCLCGCGKETREGYKYIIGHNEEAK